MTITPSPQLRSGLRTPRRSSACRASTSRNRGPIILKGYTSRASRERGSAVRPNGCRMSPKDPMGPRRTRLISCLAASLTTLLAIPLRAPAFPADAPQGPPGRVTPALIERALTELVLIETYVADVHGRALTGLTADDFELVVDGKKASIASCEMREVRAPGSDAVTVAGEASGAPPATPNAADQPRRFMLFFEDGTSAPSGLVAARRAAHQFLATGLVPTDQVAIAAYDTGLVHPA